MIRLLTRVDLFSKNACFFGLASDTLYKSYVRKVITPGFGHVKLQFSEDHRLHLPSSFDNIDISQVRFLTMERAAESLDWYEEVLRQELRDPSTYDRFSDIPDSEAIIFAPNDRIDVCVQLLTSSLFGRARLGTPKSMAVNHHQLLASRSRTRILEKDRLSS